MSLIVNNFVYSLNNCICLWTLCCNLWLVCMTTIIILQKYVLELTFEFSHITIWKKIEVTGNVPTRCYETNPGWMLLTYLQLQQFQTSMCFTTGSIILSIRREFILDGVLIVNGPTRSKHTMTQC
jgi:hypothetical protein